MNPYDHDARLFWLPQVLTAALHLRSDGALSVVVQTGQPGADRTVLDRRVWHPPLDVRWITDWIGDEVVLFWEHESDRLRDHTARTMG